jgi:hypothetical protein
MVFVYEVEDESNVFGDIETVYPLDGVRETGGPREGSEAFGRVSYGRA